MTKPQRFSIFITIVVIIFGAYSLLNHHPSVSVVESKIAYICEEKSISAIYRDSSVDLWLSDGRTLSLPQVVSGSGIRYEKEGIVFLSKGSDAFLQEQGITPFENCVENSSPTSTNGTSTFTDGAKTFSFSYPKDFLVSGGDIGYTQSWRNNTDTLGLVLAKVTIPKSSQPSTNFSEATFIVGTSSDAVAVKNCLVATNGEYASGKVALNGTDYSVFSLGDAGAGNFYDTTSYRTVLNNQCYAVEYTIHSTNIGAYSPDQGIKEFDKQGVIEELESIAQSFHFLF